jgi:hypothetical protein
LRAAFTGTVVDGNAISTGKYIVASRNEMKYIYLVGPQRGAWLHRLLPARLGGLSKIGNPTSKPILGCLRRSEFRYRGVDQHIEPAPFD